jgi:hypothetical protein
MKVQRGNKKEKDWKRDADRLFSLLVRQENADEDGIVQCCTCGRRHHWRKGMNCGHYMVRQHQSTRFDRQNTDVQCVYCNHFNEGEQVKFGEFLDKKHGEGTAEAMQLKSKMRCNRTQMEYKYLCEKFTKELTDNQYLTR